MDSVKKDRELLRAKRASKFLLVLAASGLVAFGVIHKSVISMPELLPTTIEITFEQIAEAKEEPEALPEPLPQPTEPTPQEEPPEDKVLTAEESEEKIEIPKIEEPKKEVPPPPEPVKPIAKPEKKPVVKPKPGAKPPVEKKAEAKAQEAVKAPVLAPADNSAVTRPKISALLVGLVERYKRYPKAARRAAMEGVAIVEFVVNKEGTVISARIVKPTEKTPLDKAAQDLIQKIIGKSFNIENPGLTIRIPIRYQLTED